MTCESGAALRGVAPDFATRFLPPRKFIARRRSATSGYDKNLRHPLNGEGDHDGDPARTLCTLPSGLQGVILGQLGTRTPRWADLSSGRAMLASKCGGGSLRDPPPHCPNAGPNLRPHPNNGSYRCWSSSSSNLTSSVPGGSRVNPGESGAIIA